jgi:hypothetical protein
VDGVNSYNYREAGLLKLSAEHVPFPCSLRELVLDRYGEPPGAGSNIHPMQPNELLEYLQKIDNFSLSPWVAVMGQTEAMGDPATPSREHVAILRWLGKALEIWEKQFPLEARIAAQVRRLKPLSAAFAVIDPSFLQPGAHPLHQLLDNIQARAIGWQARLDRVGAVLEQQVTKAVDDSRQWFDNRSADLSGICAEFSAAAERDQARAQRMVQRVIEAEAGKVKTTSAKQEAASMINTLLAQCPATPEIGNFIKGPWYTSAQLLLLKYGSDSEEWNKMRATTATLLDSLQSIEDADEPRRQHIFEVVTQLPKDMRRWLLSLHHDTEAVNEAMGLVEFAHLKILRRQALELRSIEPLVVEGEHLNTGELQNAGALKNWQEGQWFSVNTDTDGTVRMQLVLKVESSQQLVFTNLAGLKVLQLSYAEFIRLADQKKVIPLYSGASFSLCLAHAVGIDSVEIMNALVSALAENDAPAPVAHHSSQSAPTKQEPEPEPAPEPEPTPVPEPEPEHEPELESDLELGPAHDPHGVPHFESAPDEDLLEVDDELEFDFSDPVVPGAEKFVPGYEAREISIPSRSASPSAAVPAASSPQESRSQLQTIRAKSASTGTLFDQAQQIKAKGGYAIQPAEPVETHTLPPAKQYFGSDNSGGRSRGRRLGEDHLTDPAERTAPPTADSDLHGYPDERQINLPMGAWLGFHDGEIPLMAKLAVHDTEDDYFIFVNRKGVKMRKVSRLELLKLIDEGMVDLLQATSNFRSAVSEIRKNLDQ